MHAISLHGVFTGVGRFLEHSAAVVVGLIMMIVGLALGVTTRPARHARLVRVTSASSV